MKIIIYILWVFIAFYTVSCKQKMKKATSEKIEINDKYDFGISDTFIVDQKLQIQNSIKIYNERTDTILEHNLTNEDNLTCFLDGDTLKIEVNDFGIINYLLKIKPNNEFDFTGYYPNGGPDCAGCPPPKSKLIGKKLILNKSKFIINDTLSGIFYRKVMTYYEGIFNSKNVFVKDSIDILKIDIDSCMFKYKIEKSSKKLIDKFEKNYDIKTRFE